MTAYRTIRPATAWPPISKGAMLIRMELPATSNDRFNVLCHVPLLHHDLSPLRCRQARLAGLQGAPLPQPVIACVAIITFVQTCRTRFNYQTRNVRSSVLAACFQYLGQKRAEHYLKNWPTPCRLPQASVRGTCQTSQSEARQPRFAEAQGSHLSNKYAEELHLGFLHLARQRR